MSVQDCITDSMYKPVLLNGDAIGMPHLSGAQLHCHAGVVTATNFIMSDLERHRVLHQVLLGEPCPASTRIGGDFDDGQNPIDREKLRGHQGWTLVLCGHSLGAGIERFFRYILERYFLRCVYGASNLLGAYYLPNLPMLAVSGPSAPFMAAILSRGFPDPACSSSDGIWLMHSSDAG